MSSRDHLVLDSLKLGRSEGPQKPEKKNSRIWFRKTRIALKVVAFPFKWLLVLILPFLLLVRGSVWAYQGLQWGPWASISAGVAATLLLFLIYASWAWKRITGRRSVPKVLARGLLVLVIGYTGYGLLYLSAANAKTPEVKEYFTSLHPLLRLSASTFLLFDREAVVTDTQRTAEDYLQMGLPVNETSLHFRLEDGFVHALDLRTQGRTEWKNTLTAQYFSIMGLRTLRHVGTADHLHISLPPPPG
jgi:hypothetical protein